MWSSTQPTAVRRRRLQYIGLGGGGIVITCTERISALVGTQVNAKLKRPTSVQHWFQCCEISIWLNLMVTPLSQESLSAVFCFSQSIHLETNLETIQKGHAATLAIWEPRGQQTMYRMRRLNSDKFRFKFLATVIPPEIAICVLVLNVLECHKPLVHRQS